MSKNPPRNSDLFLESFVQIEMFLKDLLKSPNVGFVQMVNMAAKSNALVAKYQADLTEFAQLRNAIVHNRFGENEPIAEPHPHIVAMIQKMEEHLLAPKKVLDICSPHVYTTVPDATLHQLLSVQNNKNYSAIPVYDNSRFVGVVHTRLYQRLLEDQRSVIDLKTLSVAMLLEYRLASDTILFVDKNTTVHDIYDHYVTTHQKGKSIIAVILTSKGYPNEEPLGILTQADFPKVLEALES